MRWRGDQEVCQSQDQEDLEGLQSPGLEDQGEPQSQDLEDQGDLQSPDLEDLEKSACKSSERDSLRSGKHGLDKFKSPFQT